MITSPLKDDCQNACCEQGKDNGTCDEQNRSELSDGEYTTVKRKAKLCISRSPSQLSVVTVAHMDNLTQDTEQV